MFSTPQRQRPRYSRTLGSGLRSTCLHTDESQRSRLTQ